MEGVVYFIYNITRERERLFATNKVHAKNAIFKINVKH